MKNKQKGKRKKGKTLIGKVKDVTVGLTIGTLIGTNVGVAISSQRMYNRLGDDEGAKKAYAEVVRDTYKEAGALSKSVNFTGYLKANKMLKEINK